MFLRQQDDDLTGANLSEAIVSEADLSYAKLIKAKLSIDQLDLLKFLSYLMLLPGT